jgi:hypothetical protein
MMKNGGQLLVATGIMMVCFPCSKDNRNFLQTIMQVKDSHTWKCDFFDYAAKALDNGFRPCKRCCPDKVVFQQEQKNPIFTLLNFAIQGNYLCRKQDLVSPGINIFLSAHGFLRM